MADPALEALIRMKIQKQMKPAPEPPIFDENNLPEAPPQQTAPEDRPINTMLENGASFADFAPEQTAGTPFAKGLDVMADNNKALYHKMRQTPVNGISASPATQANAFPHDPRVQIDPEDLKRTQAFMNPYGPQGRELLMQAVMAQMQKGGNALMQGGAQAAQAAQDVLRAKLAPGTSGRPAGTPMTPTQKPARQ